MERCLILNIFPTTNVFVFMSNIPYMMFECESRATNCKDWEGGTHQDF
jgi:hypothetical protein